MESLLIKDIRHYKGMTQPQFAEWLGVAESSIAQVESGHRRVSDRLAAKIALKFDVTDEEFIAYRERRAKTQKFFKVNQENSQ